MKKPESQWEKTKKMVYLRMEGKRNKIKMPKNDLNDSYQLMLHQRTQLENAFTSFILLKFPGEGLSVKVYGNYLHIRREGTNDVMSVDLQVMDNLDQLKFEVFNWLQTKKGIHEV